MENCVFCKIINGDIPCYKVYEDDVVISFLSIDPVSYGHTLVIPKEHYLDFSDITLEVITHINMVSKDIYKRLWDNLKPNGFKFVQNNGSLQEVKHYHLHLIPVFDNEPGDKKDLKNVLEEILK